MARKNTPSSIDKLLPDIQELIGNLRAQGRTIDEIRAKLLELDVEVSRSALGRHVKSMAEAQVTMQRSRQMAEALVDRFGNQTDDKMARLNIELAHGLAMRLMLATAEDEETGESKPLVLTPEDVMFMSRALQSLTSASKTTHADIRELQRVAAEKATKEAAEKATTIARQRGISKDTVDAIRFAVLGSDT